MNSPTLSEAELRKPARNERQQKWPFVAAGALAAIYGVISILIARQRPFWYDEILTVIYSGQPTVAAMWKALAIGADGVPPANDLIVRLFAHLPLPLEVAARLPSALAMAAGLLVTFDCARRLTDGLRALIAVAFLTCSVLPYYGYEARPFALVFLLSAAALWLWMNTDDAKRSSAVFVGLVFFAAVFAHYYTVLWLLPYTLWELSNRSTRRVPSRKLIAAYVGVICALALLSKQILALYAIFARGFWAPASLRSLALTFTGLFPHVLWPTVGILGLAALWRASAANSVVKPMQPYEQLCWFFAVLPLTGFVAGKLVTHAYLDRYFIGMLPALAIGLACLIARHVPDSQRIALAAVVLFAAFGLANELEHLHYASSVHPIPPTLESERMAKLLALEAETPANQFIVLRTGDLLTLEAHYYARHPDRIVFLLPPSVSAPEPEAPSATGKDLPIRYWTAQELQNHAGEILIDPAQQTLDQLQRAGHTSSEHFDGMLDVVTVR